MFWDNLMCKFGNHKWIHSQVNFCHTKKNKKTICVNCGKEWFSPNESKRIICNSRSFKNRC